MRRKRKRIDGADRDISWGCWNIYYREDPIKPYDGYCIHHINGNHFDNSKNNLQKLSSSEHRSLHNIGNSYSLGIKRSEETKKRLSELHKGNFLSEETKRKLSESHKGIRNNCKCCMAEYQIFSTLKEAGKTFNVTPESIYYRIKTGKPGYMYILKLKINRRIK